MSLLLTAVNVVLAMISGAVVAHSVVFIDDYDK